MHSAKHTHTQLYSPFEIAAQLYAKNESENLTNQQHKTLKHNVTWRNQHKDDIYFQKLKTACISLQQRFEPSGKSRP